MNVGYLYLIIKFKVFISSGWNADVVIVVAVTDRNVEKAAYGISLFLGAVQI